MSIGDTYSWSPTAFEGSSGINESGRKRYIVHGKIVYINEAHRYFTAEAACNGTMLRESFKF